VAEAVALVKSKKDSDIATIAKRNAIAAQFAGGTWAVAADDAPVRAAAAAAAAIDRNHCAVLHRVPAQPGRDFFYPHSQNSDTSR
jgi:hypothetical protein